MPIPNPSLKVNRETWLLKSLVPLTVLFTQKGYGVPEVRVSIGFPSRSALGKRTQRIGECWSPTAASDGVHHILLSPVLVDSANPTRILDVLVHEMVHAVVGLDAKHGQVFKKCATDVGLTGKMTATVATPALTASLQTVIDNIGTCPGGGLNPHALEREKQTTRMRKYQCPECEQIIRAACDDLDANCNACDVPFVMEVK